MTSPRPHTPADLALAPVLIEIERNLARLRTSHDLHFDLALDLNDDDLFYHSAPQRAARVMRAATRDVDLHGWEVCPTSDLCGLLVRHGPYSVSVMFGRHLTDYIQPELTYVG